MSREGEPVVEKLDPKIDGASKDIVAENVAKLRELFPEVFTEGKIDFDVLKEVLGEYVEHREERYSFTWHGKSQARRIAQTPSTGTLRPVPEESVNWDTTRHMFIEGDNLEVLKLLQKSYHKKVKMIYIDPPYNTGKDFIYSDRFQDNLHTYLRFSGQVGEDGSKLSANLETSGRYHTNWLNMMYPRLRLARNLLRDDGVMFVTIDDHEVANLRKICDEIFGEENFVTSIAWQKKVSPSNDATWFSNDHDHILVYAKNKYEWRPNRLTLNDRQRGYYSNPDNDPRGPWNSVAYTCNKSRYERPNLYYPIVNPNTGEEVWPDERAVWAYSREVMLEHQRTGRLYWGKDGKSSRPRLKKFLSEARGVVPRTVWLYSDVGHTQEATQELRRLLPEAVFDTPKPTRLILHMLRIATNADQEDIVLDFFAGSASTAEAVLKLNFEDHGNRRFIMVQLPEPVETGPHQTIADIGKARIREAVSHLRSRIQSENGRATHGGLDLGFKVFKLDSSNIKTWDPNSDAIEDTLFDAVDNIKPGRSDLDVLYEVLLKQGIDLAIPIEERLIAGQRIFVVGGGALVVCLSDDIDLSVAEGIAALKGELEPEVMHVIFKDSGFRDDVVKTNTVQILKRAGVDRVVSV